MELTREAALQHIHENPEGYLQRARVDGYICPICGSGSGPNGTGLTVSKKLLGRFTCFAGGCFTGVDIPDIIAMKEGLQPGSREALQRAYDLYGITIIKDKGPSSTGQAKTRQTDKPAERDTMQEAKKQEDYTAQYAEWHKRIGETNYPEKRGLTSTVKRFQLGYTDSFKTTDAYKQEGEPGYYVTWKALIFPNGPEGYSVRNLDTEAGEKNRYRIRGIDKPFNLQALQGEKPVFVVEGEIDALSVIEAGGEAVALRGAGKYKELLKILEKQKPAKPLILALDKDKRGQEDEEMLAAGLKERGIPFLQADITGEYKDANEAFNSLEAVNFIQAVQNTINSIKSEEDRAREETRARYQGITAAANLEAFFAETKKGRKAYPTGFSLLDEQLRGGLFEGLTIVGAITSAGKTTLAMQMADYMAQAGHDVLIFSLETSRHELMGRSISRETLVKSFMNRESIYKGMTFRDIMDGEPGEMLEAASTAYSQYAGHLYIFQSLGKIGTRRIRAEVEGLTNEKGAAPVVIVDYLQLLGPNEGERFQGAKETMDAAVTDLKCLAVDFKTPVILISSFNRDNYSKDANLASFKESGGIEYSADLLLGLQYEGAGKQGWNQEKAEQAADMNPRKMELKIMKNRNGAWGQRISMDYYARFNFFRETGVKRKQGE